jgi:hypothetical protein
LLWRKVHQGALDAETGFISDYWLCGLVTGLAGNALLIELHVLPHGPTTPIQDAGALLALLFAAVIASLSAGYFAAMDNPSASMRTVLVLGVLLVALGAIVQSNYLYVMPLWYHVAFLALLLPACLAGAKLGRQ